MKYEAEIVTAASAVGIDPRLVTAIVTVESRFDPYAWNPEPKYRYLWDVNARKPFRPLKADELGQTTPPPDFPTLAGDPDQEWQGQRASWGLCQVMGALARELGLRAPYLTILTQPELNLTLACQHLANLLEWSKGDEYQATAAYNAGRGGWREAAGQLYASKVRRAREALA